MNCDKLITVLGAGGRVGSVVIERLAELGYTNIRGVDSSPCSMVRLNSTIPSLGVVYTDLSDSDNIEKCIAGSHAVINALPGSIGCKAVKDVMERNPRELKIVIDVSFSEEYKELLKLDQYARMKDILLIIDCGIAPGTTHILAAYAFHCMFSNTYKIKMYAAGLPTKPGDPGFGDLIAGFNPKDLESEYMRKARFLGRDKQGKLVVKSSDAFSAVEAFSFPGINIGPMESGRTDGVRTSLDYNPYMDAPFLDLVVERTARFKGHISVMKNLTREGRISEVIQKNCSHKKGQEDFTIVKVEVEGKRWGERKKYTFTLHVPYNNNLSMPIATGSSLTAMFAVADRGLLSEASGSFGPELFGKSAQSYGEFITIMKKMDLWVRMEETRI